MAQSPTRSTRLEARIAPDALAAVKRAAEIQGRSVSDFVVAAAQEAIPIVVLVGAKPSADGAAFRRHRPLPPFSQSSGSTAPP